MVIPEPDHQLKVPVVRRPEFTIYLEQATRDHTFIHCTVRRPWTRDVKARLAADFAALVSLHGGPIHALHDPQDAKHAKFLAMFGFVKAATYVDRLTGRPTEIHTFYPR